MVAGLTDDELAFLRRAFDLARNGAAEELAELLDVGLPVNLTNDSGDTLLTLAAYYSHPATVDALLAHGADHSRVNDKGQTALGAAVFRSCEPAVRALLAAGADPALGGRTAYEIADVFDLPEMMALLQSHPTGPPPA